MARILWPAMQVLVKAPNHRTLIENNPDGDRVQFHSYSSLVPGTEDLSRVDATTSSSPPQLLPHATSRVDAGYAFGYVPPYHFSSTLRYDEFNPPQQLAHPSYSLLSAFHEPSNDTPNATANRSLGSPQPPRLYSPWGSFHPSPELSQNAIHDVSPHILHHPTLDSALQHTYQSPRITGNTQFGSVDGFPPAPSNHDVPSFPPPLLDSVSFHDLDTHSGPYSAKVDASYPCQWTKDGVTCNVMVQATRSRMNRHLHAYHEFSGPDTRERRCCWTGCEATMQQGSIARHMVTCHLQAKVTCPMCYKKLSRQDVISKHQRVCPAAGTWR